MKMKKLVLTLVLALALGGCTSVNKFLGPEDPSQKLATLGQVSKMLQENNELIKGDIKKLIDKPREAAAPAEATPTFATKAELDEVRAKLETIDKQSADRDQRLAGVQAEVGKIPGLEKKLAETSKDVGSLKKEVANIKIRVVRINKAVGIALELGEVEGERYFPIGPFYSGKAELEPRGKKVLSTLIALMKKEGLIAKKVWAFADPRRAKAAKNEDEGKKMNLELSIKRAEALKKELGEPAKDAETFGRGETDKFGDLPENRMALVVLIPVPAASAAPPAK